MVGVEALEVPGGHEELDGGAEEGGVADARGGDGPGAGGGTVRVNGGMGRFAESGRRGGSDCWFAMLGIPRKNSKQPLCQKKSRIGSNFWPFWERGGDDPGTPCGWRGWGWGDWGEGLGAGGCKWGEGGRSPTEKVVGVKTGAEKEGGVWPGRVGAKTRQNGRVGRRKEVVGNEGH